MQNSFRAILKYFVILAIPVSAAVFFGFSLYLYCSALSENKKAPGTFQPSEIKNRLILLIVSSVIMGVLLLSLIGYTVLKLII